MTPTRTAALPDLHPPDPAIRLRQAGLRATAPRLTVIQALQELDSDFLGADEIFRRISRTGSRIGIGAVYRVLADLESAGLLERSWDPERRARFRLVPHDGPGMLASLVCRRFGKRIPLNNDAIAEPLSGLATENGLSIANEHIEIIVASHSCRKEVKEA